MSEGLPGTSRVNVKGLRERLGMNQAELADALHVDERTIRRWEHGASRPSPMAMAHMRTLTRARREGEVASSPQTEVTASLEHDASSALPRRRMPTF